MTDPTTTAACTYVYPEGGVCGITAPYHGDQGIRTHGFQSASLVQIGWMLSPGLAAEFDVTPLSDDYLITLEQAEQDGGIKPEFADRIIPIYRKADDV